MSKLVVTFAEGYVESIVIGNTRPGRPASGSLDNVIRLLYVRGTPGVLDSQGNLRGTS